MSLIDDVLDDFTEVFRHKEALDETYIPDQIVGRDEQVRKIVAGLSDVRDGKKPETLFIMGPNGVGKTVVTHHVIREFETDPKAKHPVQAVRIRCDNLGSDYNLAAKLANELIGEQRFNPDHPGVRKQALWDTIFTEIENFGGVTIICLDEIEHVNGKDNVLYNFGRAEKDYLTDAVIGTVCITTELDLLNQIGDDARSSLRPRKVPFGQYDADELQAVLTDRAEVAFVDGVLDESAIALAAANGKKEGGDARRALELLRGAGEIVKTRGDDRVTDEHVAEKYGRLERDEIFYLVQEKLNPSERFTASAILGAQMWIAAEYRKQRAIDPDERVKPYPNTGEIYEVYTHLVEDPLSKRQIANHLENLEDIGFTIRHKMSKRGAQDYHELAYNLDDVRQALDDFIEQHIGYTEEGVVQSEDVPQSVEDLITWKAEPTEEWEKAT